MLKIQKHKCKIKNRILIKVIKICIFLNVPNLKAIIKDFKINKKLKKSNIQTLMNFKLLTINKERI